MKLVRLSFFLFLVSAEAWAQKPTYTLFSRDIGDNVPVDLLSPDVYAITPKLAFGDPGTFTLVGPSNPLPVICISGCSGGGGGGGITPAGNANRVFVSASLSSQTVFLTNMSRLRAVAFNQSDFPCFLSYVNAATTTDFTYYIPPNTNWSMDYPFTGVINAVWSGATGQLIATELTP